MFEALTGKRSRRRSQRDDQSNHEGQTEQPKPKATREQVEAELLKSVCERTNSALTTVSIVHLASEMHR